ncbi:unnamed protein product [Caretta caretta]
MICRSPMWRVNMAAMNLASVPSRFEKEICQAMASSAPITAKMTSQVRVKTLVKTEKFITDMNCKCVPIDGNTLREKALSLYAFKSPAEGGQPSDEKEFKASQGWLNSFRNHFNLKNVQTTGEAASANEEAAKAYPEQLKKIIEEKGYLPEQVFNADETGLFWKKMPNCAYTSKSERQAQFAEVFQAAKHLNDLISEFDLSMERSLKITRSITDDLRPYQEMFEQLKRQQRQLLITMFFKEKQPAADEPT